MNKEIIAEVDSYMRREGGIRSEEYQITDGKFFFIDRISLGELFSGRTRKINADHGVSPLDKGRTINAPEAVSTEPVGDIQQPFCEEDKPVRHAQISEFFRFGYLLDIFFSMSL